MKFINELRTQEAENRLRMAHIRVGKTVEMLQKDAKREFTLSMLVMSMSPFTLQSVMMGTVARDAFVTGHRHWPSEDGPGIFAVGIAVKNRFGAFLTSNELEALASNVDKYVEAYRAHKVRSSLRTVPQITSIQFAKAVDSNIRTFPRDGCRSITCDDDADRAALFAERLRHRATYAKLLDPSGNSVQMQSPLYIGCSNKVSERIKSYDPPRFDRINKLLGLTLNLLSHMGLQSRAIARSVMPIWDHRHLDQAERLVTTLASSLVSQEGFNATEAGGNQSTASGSTFRENQMQVFVNKPYFKDNLIKATNTLKAIEDYQEELVTLRDKFRDQERSFQVLRDRLSVLQALHVRTCDEMCQEMHEKNERERRMIKQIEKQDKELSSLVEMFELLRYAYRPENDQQLNILRSDDLDVD
ncbi:hypothetical protein V2A60_001119 [Cordyceps javanica]